MTAGDHAVYALAWLAFGASHSLLASDGVKARLARLGRWYRLSYNVVSLYLLAGIQVKECRLVGRYGAAYRDSQRRVP